MAVARTERTEDTGELVLRAREGDAAALAVLARRHLRAAYAVALAVVRNDALAEDVAQDAFVVAMQRLDDCREPARFSGWLLSIVRSRALNAVDSRRVRERGATMLSLVPAPPVPPDDTRLGLRRQLLDALSQVAPVQREVVLLHDLEGWTHGEIADALDISEGMSRQHLFQARKVLRELLSSEVNHE